MNVDHQDFQARVVGDLDPPWECNQKPVRAQAPVNGAAPALPPLPASRLDEVVGAEPPRPILLVLEEPHYFGKFEAARSLARQNPAAAVASIVRTWVGRAKT